MDQTQKKLNIVGSYENGNIKPIEKYIENCNNINDLYFVKEVPIYGIESKEEIEEIIEEHERDNSLELLFNENKLDIVEIVLRKYKGIPEIKVGQANDRGTLTDIMKLNNDFLTAAFNLLLKKIDKLEDEIIKFKKSHKD